MNSNSQEHHLSRISTLWTLVQQAHAGSDTEAHAAQHQLMERYCGSVYRYLLGALRDEDTATELFQEFSLRFLRGDFRRADPQRGRFRDYVKTALIHLVHDYQRALQKSPRPLPSDLPSPPTTSTETQDEETAFISSWREELLNRTWDSLHRAHPAWHAVLLSIAEAPEMPAAQRAQELEQKLGKVLSPGNLRVIAHRARGRFAELLLEEVAHSLENPSQAELAQELHDLKLSSICSQAMQGRSQT